MTTRSIAAIENSDADLVSRSLAGDRDAFNQVVVRYQTLICSLAFNAVGNLGQSEDLAQETFITAWKHLHHLREPAKLRAWLCGIVRNLIHKDLDRCGREPVRNAETLDAAHDSPETHELPSEEAITREEQAILWRSLENIHSTYREPLILFYREHQSIEVVAEELELSEDAVKQRLSRGRKLLQDEVLAFVEKTLRSTAPGQGFAGAVLAALPDAQLPTVGVVAAGKIVTATSKSGLIGAWLAPVIGIIGGITAHWLIVRAAPTPRERRLKKIAFIGLWIFALTWCIPGQWGVFALSNYFEWSDPTFFRVMACFWWFYAMVLATLSVSALQRVLAIRQEHEMSGISPRTCTPLKVIAGVAMVVGVHLACFWWLIALALHAQDQTSARVITAAMMALIFWNFTRFRGKTGAAIMRAVAQHQAWIWGIILVILNFRLNAWLASLHGSDLAEIRRLLPVWIIPLLTCALVTWVGLLIRITRPRHGRPTSNQYAGAANITT